MLENCIQSNLNNVIKELYKRFIIPFYIPTLMLTILFLLLKSKENINYFNFRIFIFLFGFLIIISSEMSLRFIKDNIFENIKIFAIPIITSFSVYLIIYFNLYSFREKK